MVFSSSPQGASPPRCNPGGCRSEKAENPHEKQNPGSIDLQCPGESKWRDSNPRPFGPEFENVLFYPTLSANIRKLPVFSAFFQLFPPVSGNFHAVLNWTFGVFLQFYRFNHPLQPTGLQHDRTALFYIPSATRFASSTFRSSLAFNSSST